MYPNSLRDLIEGFKYLPGIGEKTAERLAFSLLDLPEEKLNFFVESIKTAHDEIHRCPICNHITDQDVCNICSDRLRDTSSLCVVEDSKNVFLFERLGIYHGLYHVLDGLISLIDGINPEDIGIDKLVERIKKGDFKEIILAVKPSIEGETTSLYIKKILEGLNLTISKIASGVPMGADMEYMDAMTLERALNDRKNIE